MSAPRFFCSTPLSADTRIVLPETLAHHAIRVLRLADATPITLFDGQGGEYAACLHLEGRQAYADLGVHTPVERELRGEITLLQGIASGDKMDWVIEKAVELGVTELRPIEAERSVLRLSGPRLEKRLAHWHAIVRAASEQCGRNRLMRILPPQRLREGLKSIEGTALFCHPEGSASFADTLTPPPARLAMVVGPEGGWSSLELEQARDAGLQGVRFGPRVLRTETAGLAMVAAATALLGW